MTTPSADPITTAGRSAAHDTIVIERRYDAAPSQVFHAFADPAAKARWFAAGEGWEAFEHELDFRVGGRERSSAAHPGGPAHVYDARYEDIVPDRRIVAAYSMTLGGRRISVSLLTIELAPDGRGTRLILTEQIAILDGGDSAADRREGLEELLGALDAELRRTTALA